MNSYIAFVKKELIENTRNYRLLIMLVLFLIFGMMSPLSARFMPELFASLAPDLQITIVEPTALDSWIQFYKNVSQLGFSIFIILFSSCLSNEYAKGSLTILLTKGLPRPSIILSKYIVSAAIMTVSYWLCFGITYGYTAFLWPGAALSHTVFAAFALWIIGFMFLSILILGCVLFKQAFSSIVFFLGVSVVLSLASMPTQFASYSPIVLTSKNIDLLSGAAAISEFIVPIIFSLIITAGFLFTAVAVFNKKQV